MHQMRYFLQISAILLLPSALTGCDPAYGLANRTVVHGPAADSCIVSALNQTAGIRGIQTKIVRNTGTLILGDGPVDDSDIRYYTYNIGEKYSPTLMVEDFYGGKTSYSNTMLSLGQKIPDEELDRALPIMRDAEQQISRLCGVDFVSNIKRF
jgi:hypothetical protein